MKFLYVLQLSDGKYYIGKTADVKRRFEQHLSGEGTEWTRRHPPIAILETRPCDSDTAEDDLTKEYRIKYGANNVRGGTYTGMYSSEYMRSWWKGKVEKDTYCSSKNLCYKCHKPGHWTRECTNEPVIYCVACGVDFDTNEELISHEKTCEQWNN
jgi:predicted GIY-YIG superfamily endonuclease